jgi:hypothetical protein
LRCEKAKLPCQGYDRASVFVNRTLTAPSTSALTAISEAKQHDSPRSSFSTASALYQDFERLIAVRANALTTLLQFRTQAFDILKALYLPRTAPSVQNTPHHEGTNAYSWVYATCQLSLESSVLDQSLLAFCAIQIYIVEPSSISLEAALQLYSEALSELVQSLESSESRSQDETLAAIVVLSTCEVRWICGRDEQRCGNVS